MITLPYETLVEKIVAGSDLSKEVVEERVKKKMSQLSGLISKEGAAHIIGNELNVPLYDEHSGKVLIKNLLPGLRDVEVVGKILRMYEQRDFEVRGRKGTVASLLLGDETGKIRVTFWGNATEPFKNFKEDDVLKIKGGYVKENNSFPEVHVNDRTTVTQNPEGVDVAVSQKQERKEIKDLKEHDNDVSVLATVVDLSEPRFFQICGECGKRVKEEACAAHPEKPLTYSYVLNGFLDDGTDNIRAVFFREQAATLLKNDDEAMQALREDAEAFTQKKKEILGSLLLVKGRVTKNKMFERTEFIVQSMQEPSAKEELARME